MRRRLLLLAAAAVLLAVWERSLASAARRERAARSRVGRMVPEEERASMPIAALKLEGGGQRLTFGRVGGRWRCLELHQAPASRASIQSLVDKLTRSQGVVQTTDVEQAPTYGINTPATIRVSICGPRVLEEPGGDVLVTFDVGQAVPGRDGAFVRRRGTPAIWSIDANPHVELAERVAPGLPPLLEPGLVPRDWPGWTSGLVRVFVDFADGSAYELAKRPVELAPEDLQAGALPWSWVLLREGAERATANQATTAFTLFLERVPYLDVLDRAQRTALGLDTPRAVVTLAGYEEGPDPARPGPLPFGRSCPRLGGLD